MDLQSIIPEIIPHTANIFGLNMLQSVFTGLLGTLTFAVFIVIYHFYKKRKPYSGFVQGVDTVFELVYEFLGSNAGKHVGSGAITFTTTIFFFVLWQNLFGLTIDMFVAVRPAAHHYIRGMTTDVISNAVMALIAVGGSVAYGFRMYGFSFIKRYFPIPEGMGIVTKIDHWYDYILKFLDLLLGLLLGLIELFSDLGKVLSLSLRLFGNMFVGILLLLLLVSATQYLIGYTPITPLIVFAYEFAVSALQAFIFAVLTTSYFRLAAEEHASEETLEA